MNMHVGGADAQRVQFKVGDRVRVVVPGYDSESGHGASAGEEHVVERVDDDGVGTGVWYFFNNEIEPVADANDGSFKVGDKVRFKNGGILGGASGTIVDTASGYEWSIRLDEPSLDFGHTCDGRTEEDRGRYADSDDIEPVAVAEQQQSLTIQAGKYYRTRDGRKVGPAHKDGDEYEVGGWLYNENGGFFGAKGDYHEDIIAEWVDEPVKAEPKFTVGDRVICPTVPEAGVGIIEAIKPEGGYRVHYADSWYGYCHGSDDDLAEAPVPPTSPAIVALLDNGQPLPARKPYVHASVADASKEATRLAKANPGREFAVYEMVHSVTEEPQHEWQRLALAGDCWAAEAELMRTAGIGKFAASQAVVDLTSRP